VRPGDPGPGERPGCFGVVDCQSSSPRTGSQAGLCSEQPGRLLEAQVKRGGFGGGGDGVGGSGESRLANRVNMGLSYKNKTFLAITPLIITLIKNSKS
jgi:hypothetical protein